MNIRFIVLAIIAAVGPYLLTKAIMGSLAKQPELAGPFFAFVIFCIFIHWVYKEKSH